LNHKPILTADFSDLTAKMMADADRKAIKTGSQRL